MEEQHTEGSKMVDQTEEYGAEDGSDLMDLNEKGEEMDEAISPEEFKEGQYSNPVLGL